MSKSIYRRSLAGLSAAALALVGFVGAAYADPAGEASPNPEATQTTPPTETDAPGDGSKDGSDGKDADGTERPEESEPSEDPAEADTGEADTEGSDGKVAGNKPVGPDMSPMKQNIGTATIDLLNITDFHGRIATAPTIGAFVKQVRAENPGTVFTSSGDNIGATTYESSSQDDKPTIDVLNLAGLNVSAVGNHEFDKGWADFVKKRGLASWDYLGANVDGEDPDLAAFQIRKIDGVNVAFVGLLTEGMDSLVSSNGVKGISWASVTERANEYAERLTDGDQDNGEADVLVALIHEGPASADITAADPFKTFANGISEKYTAVFSGHTHLTYNTEHRGIQFLQAGEYGKNIAHLKLKYNLEKEQDDFYKPAVEKSEVLKVSELTVTPDPEIEAVVAEANAKADEAGKEVVGYIGGDFMRGATADGSENRGSESTIGNMVADAHLAQARITNRGTDFAVMNPGGIRADLLYDAAKDGAITLKEASMVQPFANSLMVVELTGAEVKQLLEQQWQRAEDGAAVNRPFLKLGVSGFSYTYDPKAAEGDRIKTILLANGEEIDMKATYEVAANSFLASGGDNFHVFKGKAAADTGQIDLNATVEYIKKNATKDNPLKPSYGQKSIGIHDLNGNLTKGILKEGTPIEMKFSSLTMSREALVGKHAPSTLTCSFLLKDDTLISKSQAPIDNTITDAWDETGQATITMTVPDLSDHVGKKLLLVCGADVGESDFVVREGTITGNETPTPDPTDPVDPKPTPKPKPEMPVTGAKTEHLGLGALLMVAVGLAVAGSRRTALKG